MKKNRIVKTLAFVLLAGVLTVLKAGGAQAAGYVPAVSDLKQTAAAKDAITVAWGPSNGAVEYHVSYKELGESGDYILAGKTAEMQYTLSGLKDGTKYYIQVKASDGTKESIGKTLYDAVTIPDQMEGLRQKSWYYFIHKLEIEWTAKSGVSGYEVSLCDKKGKELQKKEITYGSSTFFDKVKDNVYTVQARAYTLFGGQKNYSSTGVIHCIPQARISKMKLSGGTLSLSWKKVDGATGYKIYMSEKSNKGYKSVKSLKAKSTRATIGKWKGKKLNSKKTYYVYVETICNKGKIRGTSGALYAWSTKTNKYVYLH